ncbi:multi-sensor signal transduction histidine kinase [Ruminiclostridium papyrosolvens DSM 2782]|uniref:histidine kinase n=1 Tax=Ruminiclostridium papyrosolvens DSM 2782 TaxID=588581 RepID=F1TB67_9FIRM|nr:ATP-binding protein [Ruminiclostridium papyrosolvens]EGD48271.1 multi-sensor signal transduction histidine kinase [Ruminiclostridium papyrosolvens DSM 2782]WES34222.1 ATP-binding protein [Ruminiclostridium papyrosolvens DSM 2782]
MIKTLKGKVSLLYLSLVILIAVVGITAAVNLFSLSRAIDGLMISNYKSINAANMMMEAIERQDSAALLYINADTQKGKELFTNNSEVFFKWYNIDSNNITEKGEKDIVNAIKVSYTRYMKLFLDLEEIRSQQGVAKANEYFNTEMSREFTNTKNELRQLSVLNEKAMFKSKAEATKNAQDSMYLVLGISTVAFIGGFAVSRYFTDRFLKPITLLTQTMKMVKAGDLNQVADIFVKDEIGELSAEFNNMTKRLQQYEQSTMGNLLAEKNKSVAIVKCISDPLVFLDTEYRIILLNDAFEKIFNVSEEVLTNKHFLEGIRNGEIFDFISDTFRSGSETEQKIFAVKANCEDYYFNIIVTTVKDNNANLSGIIAVFQNVTHLKELEKIRTDFIATISHEFKTPLTSIVMGTDILSDEGVGNLNDDQRQIIKAIREDSDRLTKLVNDLLELTRIESGKAIFKIKEYAIDDIIECAVKPFYQIAEQQDKTLYFKCDEDMPRVIADFEKITWVLNNLISNALKYTNAGDEISVIASVDKENTMYVTVKDTGLGIPEEYIDNIFEKFVQVKDADFEVRGTGLGLAVVKEIIEAHHGRIWCESRLDVGSSFSFTLNVAGRNKY